jgi:membrane-associated phospholipid phosphatase
VNRLPAEAHVYFREWRRRSHEAPAINIGLATGLAVVVLLLLALVAWQLDARAAYGVRELPRVVYRVFSLITQLGSSGYIFLLSFLTACAAALVAASCRDLRLREGLRLLAGRALLVFAIAATSGIASQALKHLVGRARPRLIDNMGAFHFDPFSFTSVQASFPSGHTITAFAAAWTLGLFLPKWRIVLFSLAILVGISRIMVGAHYPADVLAGAAVGLVSAWLTARAFAGRRLVLEFAPGGLVARGQGLIVPSLRVLAGAGKAPA